MHTRTPRRSLTPLLLFVALGVIGVASCSEDLSRPARPESPSRTLTGDTGQVYGPPDTTTNLTYQDAQCSLIEKNLPDGPLPDGPHCSFMTFNEGDIEWMDAAIDDLGPGSDCDAAYHWLSIGMIHGWLHKMNFNSASIHADSHFPTSVPSSGTSRMHLDANNAFSSYPVLRFTMYHEAMHIVHPELVHEYDVSVLAAACLPPGQVPPYPIGDPPQ